jgi:hypothetical protein
MEFASRFAGNRRDWFRANDSCKRVSAPAGVIFYAQVRPNQPLRPIFHTARGIREYPFFRRRSNPSAWPCEPRDGFQRQGAKTEWQE